MLTLFCFDEINTFSHWLFLYFLGMLIDLISITAETVGIFSVTSAHKGELLSLQMRMLNQFEFVTDAWYVPFLPTFCIFMANRVQLDSVPGN